MTETEFEIYLRKALDAPLGEAVVRWNARDLWNTLSQQVYEKYSKRLISPTHYCESVEPFAIKLIWDDKDGAILGCLISESPEIYTFFNKRVRLKKNANDTVMEDWTELLYLPKIQIPERLMEVFYLYYLEKNNGH